ncbi:hypothetical protein D9611_012312 [Ephemerocybe angulata]|uniref:Uncharacterized protein n=1 Tax=Ephemerocybe angulata TaxID=980116 RepID=A0A8H5AUM6_9AGAR|nr:hypothetical protein D9611_012312 [Tulosesus angulatus]
MTSYDMENVSDFALTANVTRSVVYMPQPAPTASPCEISGEVDGGVYHRFVNIQGPILARDVADSTISGAENAASTPVPRPAAESGSTSEHFYVRNCSSWIMTGTVNGSIIFHGKAYALYMDR